MPPPRESTFARLATGIIVGGGSGAVASFGYLAIATGSSSAHGPPHWFIWLALILPAMSFIGAIAGMVAALAARFGVIGYLLFVVIWAPAVHVVIGLLGGRLELSVRFETLAALQRWFAVDLPWSVPCAIVTTLALALIARRVRPTPSWALVAAALFLVGTPVAVLVGRLFPSAMWATDYGVALRPERLAPVFAGCVAAWFAASVIAHRRGRAASGNA